MQFSVDNVFLSPADSFGRDRMMKLICGKHKDVREVRIANSILSRPIEGFYVGSGKRYVLVCAAHHALESITSNIAYVLLDYLLSKSHSGKICGVDCKLLLSKYCFIIVPCVNPDGIELRYHGADSSPLHDRQMKMSGGNFSSWQANARGVDLNHNYDYRFSEYKLLEKKIGILPGATLYSGEHPESEPEVRGVANLVRTLLPCTVVSLHSQGEEIYSFPHTPKINRIAKRLADMTGYQSSMPTGTGEYGGLCDYTSTLGIPSFTFEVGIGKNPLPENCVPDIFSCIGGALSILPTLL